MSSFPYNGTPKTPFNIVQNIARARGGAAYQESLIARSRQQQYALQKTSQALTNSQTLLNQIWRTTQLHYSSIVASINDLLR